ncbi:MAG: HAD-IB family hydrolase, partial [Bacteroidota bacterium]
MIVAAFDFDGTLTTRDSLWLFLRYFRGRWGFWWRTFSLLPTLIAFRMGWLKGYQAKERVLARFLKGVDSEKIFEKGEAFTQEVLPKYLRKEALDRLAWHQRKGHTCFLVTASPSFWTLSFANQQRLTLLSTLPLIRNGIFTGRIEGKNNQGPEKVNRLEKALASYEVRERFA